VHHVGFGAIAPDGLELSAPCASFVDTRGGPPGEPAPAEYQQESRDRSPADSDCQERTSQQSDKPPLCIPFESVRAIPNAWRAAMLDQVQCHLPFASSLESATGMPYPVVMAEIGGRQISERPLKPDGFPYSDRSGSLHVSAGLDVPVQFSVHLVFENIREVVAA
jgi:hypothetical protein